MVGVGIEAQENSLARVSIVNYYGAVQMDEIVQQKERVVDYRTKWSGIRATDMVNGMHITQITLLQNLRRFYYNSQAIRRGSETSRRYDKWEDSCWACGT